MSATRLMPNGLVCDRCDGAGASFTRRLRKTPVISMVSAAIVPYPGDAAALIDQRLERLADKAHLILAATEESVHAAVSDRSASKTRSEEANQKSPVKPASPQALPAAKREVASQAVPAGSDDNVQKEKIRSDAPRSILQMVEGRETELLRAVVIAAAFFAVGWLCGGNYYLRRDRRFRTKLRF